MPHLRDCLFVYYESSEIINGWVLALRDFKNGTPHGLQYQLKILALFILDPLLHDHDLY